VISVVILAVVYASSDAADTKNANAVLMIPEYWGVCLLNGVVLALYTSGVAAASKHFTSVLVGFAMLSEFIWSPLLTWLILGEQLSTSTLLPNLVFVAVIAMELCMSQKDKEEGGNNVNQNNAPDQVCADGEPCRLQGDESEDSELLLPVVPAGAASA
jgi:drug/metabolite transporter (DMT)-like permease